MSGSTERHKFTPARRAPGPGPIVRWIPAGILVLVILGFLSAVLPPGGERSWPGGRPTWLPMARGEITFLGASSPFRLLRRGMRDAFRVEEPPGTAFESLRLESVVQSFLRQRLAGVQVSETLRLRLEVEPGEAEDLRSRPDFGRDSLDWRITFREVAKDREVWFLLEQEVAAAAGETSTAAGQGAPPAAGPTGERGGAEVKWMRGPLWGEALRTLSELKEKVARELARETIALFPDAV